MNLSRANSSLKSKPLKRITVDPGPFCTEALNDEFEASELRTTEASPASLIQRQAIEIDYFQFTRDVVRHKQSTTIRRLPKLAREYSRRYATDER